MANRIQYRRDTAANWTAANPVLALGEPAWETDTKLRKVGDGTTAWTGLGYQANNQLALDQTYLHRGKASEGATIVTYGDSYCVGNGSNLTSGGYHYRTHRRIGTSVQNMRGVGGSKISDVCNQAIGTGAPYVAGLGNIVTAHAGINDIRTGDGANGVTALAEYQLGLPALVATLNAGSRIEQNNAAFVLTGTWTLNAADTPSSGGSRSYTSTLNDSYAFTVPTLPAGVTSVGLIVIAQSTLQTITWKKNGVTLRTVNYQCTNLTGSARAVETITGVVAGDVITAVNVAGVLQCDAALIPSATPPPVFWLLPAPVLWTVTAPTNGTDALLTAQNSYTTSTLAAYTNFYVVDPTAPPAGVAGVWDKTVMLAPDGLHPNDRGHSYLADCLATKIRLSLTLPTTGLHQ